MSKRYRRADIVQLYFVGFALVFLFTMTALTYAQAMSSQDAINATLFERVDNIIKRQDRFEQIITAAIVALIANFVAHVVQIREQRKARHEPDDAMLGARRRH